MQPVGCYLRNKIKRPAPPGPSGRSATKRVDVLAEEWKGHGAFNFNSAEALEEVRRRRAVAAIHVSLSRPPFLKDSLAAPGVIHHRLLIVDAGDFFFSFFSLLPSLQEVRGTSCCSQNCASRD